MLAHAAPIAWRALGALVPGPVRHLQHEIDERMHRIPTRLNAYGYDPWGFHPRTAARAMLITALLYRYWFRAETRGVDNLPPGRAILIANHAGQIALDAAMIITACFLEAEPPRVVRGMGEFWLPTVPGLSVLMVRTGSVVGTPKNCVDLLEAEELVIAFPEGVRGLCKTFDRRYRLAEFGLGFMRLALETHSPVVPVAVIGSEEQAPSIANLRPLARLLGLPAFPVTLTWPHCGPIGMIPLPVKYRITIGEPMFFSGDPRDEDGVVREKVERVKGRLQQMITAGLEARRHVFW